MSIHEYVRPRTGLRAELEFRRSQRNIIPAWSKQVLTGPTRGRSTASSGRVRQQIRLEQNREIRDDVRGLEKPLHDIEEAKTKDDSLWEECDNSGHYLVRTVLSTAHDPFCSSRGHLEPRQLSLVYTYLNHLAPSTFGIPRETTYVPANRITSLCFQYSESGTLWTAILAEEMICHLSGQPRSRDMVLQKAMGRKVFENALRDYRRNFPAAWLALIKAAQVSLWFGDTRTQSVHWITADLLVKSVGGLKQALILAADIEPIYIASPFYWVRSLIHRRHSLEEAVIRCFKWLNILLRQDRRWWCKDQVSPMLEGGPSRTIMESDAPEVESEVLRCFEAFILPTVDSSVAPHRFQLMTCIELCWNYYAFSMDASLLHETLLRVRDLICRIPDPQTKQELERRLAAYSAILCRARQDTLAAACLSTTAWTVDSNVRITQLEIDGASVFDHLGPKSRYEILTKLYKWLVGLPKIETSFTVSKVQLYKEEALGLWAATARSRA